MNGSQVLVTGTTGFLGSHFLAWAPRFGREAIALVRAGDDEHARHRVLAARKAAISSYARPADFDAIRSPLSACPADVIQPLCGLAPTKLDALGRLAISEIWNFAACLHFRERHGHLRAVNQSGPENVVELAATLGVKRMVHVSTAYAAGAYRGTVEERLHPLPRAFSNDYERTKCEAEHAVAESCARLGIALTILRPSIVVGPSCSNRTGGSNSGLYGLLVDLIRWRRHLAGHREPIILPGNPDCEVNLMPIDRVMADIANLIDSGFETGSILHLTASGGPKAGAIAHLACEILGLPRIDLRPEGRHETPLARNLAARTDFYRSYACAPKTFVRSLPRESPVGADEVKRYLSEAERELRERDVH